MGNLLTQLQQMVSRFLAWWLGELAACIPARLRGRMSRRSQRLFVEISNGTARFRFGPKGSVRELGQVEIPEAGAGAVSGAVASLLKPVRKAMADISLLLTPQQSLRHPVQLPLATAENLSEVLKFEMDRHTPYDAGQVYFDYRIVGSDLEAQQINVDLVVAPRPAVDRNVQALAAWSLTPDRVGIVGDDDRSDLNLLPAQPPSWREQATKWVSRGLILIACAVLLLATYLPILEQERVLADLEDKMTAARVEAVAAGQLRKQVDERIARNHFLVEQKLAKPTVTALLDEITRLLPDNTWIIKADLKGDKLSLSGYSATASALIGFLEESDLFSQVRFNSPVTLDPRVGMERFNLSGVVVPQARGESS